MRGVRLSHGVIFVTDGTHTVRLTPSGECDVSPILFNVLTWELEKDRPFEDWNYMSESEIRNLPDGVYQKIQTTFDRIYQILGNPN